MVRKDYFTFFIEFKNPILLLLLLFCPKRAFTWPCKSTKLFLREKLHSLYLFKDASENL